MGSLPYPHYYFMTMVTEQSGALEHKNSYLGMTGRLCDAHPRRLPGFARHARPRVFPRLEREAAAPDRARPVRLRKRKLREDALGRRGLHRLLRRQSCRDAPALLTATNFSTTCRARSNRCRSRPAGWSRRSNMASFDTWIKQYRPDENTANMSVNYYPKGAVIAFLLDAKIRKATNGARTLDTGMQWAMQRYSGDKGYTTGQFYAVMSEAAGADLKDWFAKTAESTDELDYTEALDYYGLRFRPVDMKTAAPTSAAARATTPAVDRHVSATRHAGSRRRVECGRRDPRHRRCAGEGGWSGGAARAVSPWRQDLDAGRATRSIDEDRRHARRRSRPAVAARDGAERDGRAEGQLRDIDEREVIRDVKNPRLNIKNGILPGVGPTDFLNAITNALGVCVADLERDVLHSPTRCEQRDRAADARSLPPFAKRIVASAMNARSSVRSLTPSSAARSRVRGVSAGSDAKASATRSASGDFSDGTNSGSSRW